MAVCYNAILIVTVRDFWDLYVILCTILPDSVMGY